MCVQPVSRVHPTCWVPRPSTVSSSATETFGTALSTSGTSAVGVGRGVREFSILLSGVGRGHLPLSIAFLYQSRRCEAGRSLEVKTKKPSCRKLCCCGTGVNHWACHVHFNSRQRSLRWWVA